MKSWLPSPNTDPRWFSDALPGAVAAFQRLGSRDRANYSRKLRNATKVLVLESETRQFVSLRWAMAHLAGASWDETSASETITQLTPYERLFQEAGMNRLLRGDVGFEELRVGYAAACHSCGEGPSKKGWVEAEGDNRKFYVLAVSGIVAQPEEIDPSSAEGEVEGNVRSVFVNRYERSKKNRDACISTHGLACKVCGLNFLERYGELGLGFIHVHHLLPLSKCGSEYKPDPISDLVPLCPNCHAMIHRMDDLADLEGLRARIRTQKLGKHQ